jgi:hypothetical protein
MANEKGSFGSLFYWRRSILLIKVPEQGVKRLATVEDAENRDQAIRGIDRIGNHDAAGEAFGARFGRISSR